MTVGLRLDNIITEVGPGAILHGFFSTVSAHLEPKGWGSRFPILTSTLYQGKLEEHQAQEALQEIAQIISELKKLPGNQVVWDIENRKEMPPRDYDDGCDKSSLYSYFRTTTGRNLAFEIQDNIEAQVDGGGTLEVISYRSIIDTIR